MNKTIRVNAYFLPPVSFFEKIENYPIVEVEAYENYTKQSYRNRCNILSANGVLPISVPIKNGNKKQLMKDVEISYDTSWQRAHFAAIKSAYNSTPFFEFLQDYFTPFFTEKYNFLLDFNVKLLQTVFYILKWKKEITFTTEFQHKTPDNISEFRNVLHPKEKYDKLDESNEPLVEYHQVFQHKFGFTPNLSIIDYLFNEGFA